MDTTIHERSYWSIWLNAMLDIERGRERERERERSEMNEFGDGIVEMGEFS